MKVHETKRFVHNEALSGIVLLLAALIGFGLSNSPWHSLYDAFIYYKIPLAFGSYDYTKPVIFWVNDGLISIFFLYVGLEIKGMILDSTESLKTQLSLPLSAAIAGAIIPALIYTIFNYANDTNMRGWATPTAMDTAFIIGIIATFGKKISNNLKIFIISLSIMDDILAILVIAFFYAETISHIHVILTVSTFGLLILINQMRITHKAPYIILGMLLWLFVLGSGVHTSIAGVLLAISIPHRIKGHTGPTHNDPLSTIKEFLHPIITFFILPLFAIVNTDVPVSDVSLEEVLSTLSLGIACGLFLGKQIGVFGSTYLFVKYGRAKLPTNTSWLQLYGISILCGIGFTMSLFISDLAFEDNWPQLNQIAKVAIFIGSILSAVVGFAVLKFATKLYYAQSTKDT